MDGQVQGLRVGHGVSFRRSQGRSRRRRWRSTIKSFLIAFVTGLVIVMVWQGLRNILGV
jgi:hypothetical protein